MLHWGASLPVSFPATGRRSRRDEKQKTMAHPAVPTDSTLLAARLRELLRQALGSQVELVDFKIGHQLADYVVLLVELRRPAAQVVVKLAGPEAPIACPFDRTARLHRLVATGTAIPMPEILAVDMSYRTVPWRYLIKRYIPGQEWAVVRRKMTPSELADAYREIGSAVAQLHAIDFPAFGELAPDGTVLNPAPFAATLAGRARHFIQSERLRDLFLTVLAQRADLFDDVGAPRLCHEDLHEHNILFQHTEGRWHLATILDFDKAWAGHCESDLARLEFWRGMMAPEFWETYASVHTLDPRYPPRRLVYQLLWCLEYAEPTAVHLADTRRVCTALGLEPLEHF